MADTEKALTSAEFSKITGMAVSTINRMLRQGKLRGEKRSGKWAIFPDELQNHAITDRQRPAPVASPPAQTKPTVPAGKHYDVETFARMTYLTEKGVRQWLKTGRLSGGTAADGTPFVDAANLDRSDFQHLVRR